MEAGSFFSCALQEFCAGATAQFLSAATVASLGAWLLETPHAECRKANENNLGIAKVERPP
jgi:hypothetical protein